MSSKGIVNANTSLDQTRQIIEGNHIGSVAERLVGTRVGLDEDAVAADGGRGSPRNGTMRRSPSLLSPLPAGFCTLCVASKITGTPNSCIQGMARKSLTS